MLEAGTFGSPFTFTGEQTDANGLVYLRARYYSPALGMFPSLDPVEGDPGRAMSLNRYGYVAGNVVNAVDPSGMIMESPSRWVRCVPSGNPQLLQGLSCPELQFLAPFDSRCMSSCVSNPCADLFSTAQQFGLPGVAAAPCVQRMSIFEGIEGDFGDESFVEQVRVARCSVIGSCYIGCLQARSVCPQVGFLMWTGATPSSLSSAGNRAGVNPSLVGGLIETEWQRYSWAQLFVSSDTLRIGSELVTTNAEPSYGFVNIQASLAASIIQAYPDVFGEYAGLTQDEVGDLLHRDANFAILTSAFLVAYRQREIVDDLFNEVGITVGDGGCSVNNCQISSTQLEDLVIVSYKQGWTGHSGAVLNLLRTNRSGAIDWHDGVVATIRANQGHIDRVRNHQERVSQCLS